MGGYSHCDKEKRRVERKNLVFYLRVYEDGDSAVLGHIVNLSSRGVMLCSTREIPVNRQFCLTMRFSLELGESGGLRADATSCWCRQDSDPDFFRSGFRFDSLAPSDKNHLFRVLERLSYAAFEGKDQCSSLKRALP